MSSSPSLSDVCTQVRRDIVRMVHGASSGHPGGSLGCTDFLVKLYFEEMTIDPANWSMDGRGEDLFFLSMGTSARCGTACSLVGATSPSRNWLRFRLPSRPPRHRGPAGIRVASGSLGQGLSVACGAARSTSVRTAVYSLHGDGELQEGQIWEAPCTPPTTRWTT